MALSKEQVTELKKQLAEQIKDLPDGQKASAQKQIDDMSDEAIELMLKQQKDQTQQQPIFRSIVSGEIPSKILDENKDSIAVLDIKPISKGHTIIIPKKTVTNAKDLPNSAFTLAKKLSKKICKILKSEGTEIQTQFSFGEIIINIIPIYDKPLSINSPREKVIEEDLFETEKLLRVIKKPKVIRIGRKPQNKSKLHIKRRTP